jgi:hypothetical protein
MNLHSTAENEITALRSAISDLQADPTSDAAVDAVLRAAIALVAASAVTSEFFIDCMSRVRNRAAWVKAHKSEAKRMPDVSALKDAVNQLIQASKKRE